MAQLLVRNIDDALKEELRQSARENGRSLESEVRERLRSSVEASRSTARPRFTRTGPGLGSDIARILADSPIQNGDIQELSFLGWQDQPVDDREHNEDVAPRIVELLARKGVSITEEEVAEIVAVRPRPRPDPNFWRDYGKGRRDYGITQEGLDRIEEIKREPIPESISFE